MSTIYQAFVKLAEKMNGAPLSGQLAKDFLWLVAALFGFWLLILIALTPYLLLRWACGRK
jgi:hypothetical protein